MPIVNLDLLREIEFHQHVLGSEPTYLSWHDEHFDIPYVKIYRDISKPNNNDYSKFMNLLLNNRQDVLFTSCPFILEPFHCLESYINRSPNIVFVYIFPQYSEYLINELIEFCQNIWNTVPVEIVEQFNIDCLASRLRYLAEYSNVVVILPEVKQMVDWSSSIKVGYKQENMWVQYTPLGTELWARDGLVFRGSRTSVKVLASTELSIKQQVDLYSKHIVKRGEYDQ